ncbi:Uncharacterised protein [Legionella feeleii]|uniref:Uncharacterized protein n=1 Tax=Legionella feeleii TaxID=453 RepID=A0A2X1QTL5_9GAMM|nr:Uncharacterised protein [Legionella feeleii]
MAIQKLNSDEIYAILYLLAIKLPFKSDYAKMISALHYLYFNN